jgi:hypothetical protein
MDNYDDETSSSSHRWDDVNCGWMRRGADDTSEYSGNGAVFDTDGGSECAAGCCGDGNTRGRYGTAGGKQHAAAERGSDSEADCCGCDASSERVGYGEAGADCNASTG